MPRPSEEQNDLHEVGAVESDARALEAETMAWSDALRLSAPGAQPCYGDLLSALDAASDICARMASDPDNTTAETRYLEGVNQRIQKLGSDVKEHEASTEEH
ncbi:MAG TPA: hypothetical protein VGF56_10835 [Rhizomicrobium sp.]|jgi:hypothetical protein